MTVIAWDGKTLAADRQMSQGDFWANETTKIYKKDGVLFGICACIGKARELLAWYLNGKNPETFPVYPDDPEYKGVLLVIEPDGSVYQYMESPYPPREEYVPFSIGCGGPYAMGAFHMGAKSVEAVQAAIKFSNACGGGIDTLTFDSPDTL